MADIALRQVRSPATGALIVLLTSAVVLQRLAIPGTSVPLLLPVYIAIVIYMAANQTLVVTRAASAAAALLLMVIALAFLGWLAVAPPTAVLNWSLILLLLWAPFLFQARGTIDQTRVMRMFVWVTGAGAVFAIAQFVAQLLGLPFIDPIGLLPEVWRIPGYLQTAPIVGLEAVDRSNGVFFFLEPSFASQFFALAFAFSLGRSASAAVLFLLAVLSTGSGTGLLAVVAATVGVVANGSLRARLAAAAGIAFTVALLASTPLIHTVSERASEFTVADESGFIRFVAPWEHLLGFATNFGNPIFSGLGAGTSATVTPWVAKTVNMTLFPQLAIEFGFLFAVPFVLLLIVKVLRARLPLSARFVILAMLFALSGSLYQAFTIVTVWSLVQAGSPLATSSMPGHRSKPGREIGSTEQGRKMEAREKGPSRRQVTCA